MPWAPSYATVTDLRNFVRIDDAQDDTVIETALDAASRAIDDAADPRPDYERQFGQTTTAEPRFYTAARRGYGTPYTGQWIASTDDIASATGLLVEVAGVAVTGATLLPRNAERVGKPYTSVLFAGSSLPQPSPAAEAVAVTAVYGWPTVPVAIQEACLLQASRLLARRDAPFGVAGSPEVGSEVRLMAKLDPDAEAMVRPFVRKIGTVLA